MTPIEGQLTSSNQDETAPQDTPSIGALLRVTFERWYLDNIPRHAAALAFYTLFAIAPLLLLSVEVMGLIYGRDIAETQLAAQIEQFIHSTDAANLAQTILNNALPSSASWWVTAGIVIVLLYGASAVFNELQIVLNIIWGVYPTDGGDFRQLVKDRLLAILMVIVSGLLIVCGLIITLWYAEATNELATNRNYDQVIYFAFIFGIMALIFTLIYQFVPAVKIDWEDVIIGAVSTALLISLARLVLTLYFSYNRIDTIYGAAGSLVVVLLWVYYASQIFFLGAEFTHVYSRTYGAWRRNEPIQLPNNTSSSATIYSVPGRETENVETEQSPLMSPEPLVVKADKRPDPDVEVEIVNIGKNEEAVPVFAATDTVTTKAEEATTADKRSWLSLPRLRPRKPTLTLPSVPPLPGSKLSVRIRAIRQRLVALVRLPLQILRPFREIIMAVGVIGALSVAALVGFPWRKRRPPTDTGEAKADD